MKNTNELYLFFTVLTAIFLMRSAAKADVTGYWRMEQDLNAGSGVTITNETGYNSLIMTGAGSLDTGHPDSVMTNLLDGGVTNNASLAGGNEINAYVSSYTNLNSNSITIEFFARSAENDAGFVTRATGSDGVNFSTNGVSIVDPNDLDIYYAIDDGAGGTTNVTWNSIYDSAGKWNHYAFTYDAASGIGAFYLNGVLRAMKDGPDNRALDWGDGTAAIRVCYGMDGGSPLIGKGLFDELRISDVALTPDDLLHQPLIACDSFTLSNYDYSYIAGKIKNSITNQRAIVGTVGFSTNLQWAGSDTSNMSISSAYGLNHNLIADETTGALLCKAKDDRTQYRQLSSTISEVPTYYMCVLLRAQTTEPDENISLGFSDAASNRNKGIHVGYNNGKLAVFAGGNTYDISSTPYEFNINYLVVLRLTANASGDDVIDVYLAENGAETIDLRESITVETFSSTADIAYLKTHIVGHMNDAYQAVAWRFDEIRLATNPVALGIDPSLLYNPPPAGTVFILL